jgi:hypothetical protein
MMRIGAPLAKVPTAADIHAAADHRLDRFRAGLDVEDFKIEPVLLEDAAALAEFGDTGVPSAALRDRNFQRFLRPAIAARAGGQSERAEGRDQLCPCHYVPPVVAASCRCCDRDHMSRYAPRLQADAPARIRTRQRDGRR